MNKPLLSIVIANYNYGRFLEAAIKSVVEQDGFDKCELIIVDGGSTDNSVEIIKKYEDKIAWWVSEKDKGQSDAFNKGFAHARGKLGCWVNADDLLLPGTIKSVIGYISTHKECEWISGGMVFLDSEEKVMWMRLGMQPWSRKWKWMPGWCIGGPSSFFSIERLHRVGGFDVNRYYSMDIDLWYKFFQSGMHLHHIRRYFWGFRAHEDSKTSYTLTSAMNKSMLREKESIMQIYGLSVRRIKIGSLFLKGLGFLSGSMIKSYIDSWRYKGNSVEDMLNKRV